MEELHDAPPEGHLLLRGSGEPVPFPERTGSGLPPRLQPLDVAQRPGQGTEPSSIHSSRVTPSGWPDTSFDMRCRHSGAAACCGLVWPQAWAETHASSHGPRWAVRPGGAFPRTAPIVKHGNWLREFATCSQSLMRSAASRDRTAGVQLKSYTT